MADDFVHLHVHSEYSLLDGLGRIKNLVKEAVKLGQPALALTDHGAMHGAIEFFRACRDAGIRPLVGVEAYQTAWGRPMGGRDPQLDRENYHLLLLAKNMVGYHNLLKIASHSQLDGYYYKPRVDHDFLAAHAEGIVASTGCLGAEVPQLLLQGKEREAYERLGWYVELFGKENFFVELQEHSIPDLVKVNKTLVPWAARFGLNLVATNDVHYVRAQDGGPHDVLLCVQTGVTIDQPNRMRMSDGSYFLKSRAQMEATFQPLLDLPASAFEHSLRVAEMCELDLEDPTYHLPDLPIPAGHTYESYLRQLTEEGVQRLYGARAAETEVQERKERELRTIHAMGFDVYYLIVADLCDFARSRNIWWNVRGSGAGSLVAYCTGITGIDPLKNNLIFERFLNPGRVTMPDFDLDYPDDQREEMIRYTVEKYGESQVAQIATFNRMKAKAAVRDVGRAQGVDLAKVDYLAKLIPGIPGKPVTIQDCLTEGHEFYSQELVELYAKEEWVKKLLDTAMQLEGVARNAGIHAAAVIVADRELTHYTPLMRGSKSTVTSTIAQYEFPILESIGLLKVDFLGLSTLSVMREAAQLIQQRHNIAYTLENIPYEGDVAREAFTLLSSGEVSGVFQVESQGMRRVLTEMKPSAFEHIVAMISLYRPGPLEYIPAFIRRMHGEEPVEYKHPLLSTILAETYGIIVYQEQIIQLLSALAGYTPGEADLVRRAIGKKKASEIEKHKKIFVAGCEKNGIDPAVAEAIYGDIEFFARYGFNKSHAADYAVITVQTAYLKAHYPVDYMAAQLLVERDKTEKVVNFVSECRRMGIDVLPPDVNYSGLDFDIQIRPADTPQQAQRDPSLAYPFPVPEGSAIRFGMAAIKNVGEGPVQTLLAARQAGGSFKSLEDFCDRVDLRQVNKRALECLIKAGAFDRFGRRSQLLAVIDLLVGASASVHEARESGQLSIFDLFGGTQQAHVSPIRLPDLEEVKGREKLQWEKELLGVYSISHPLQQIHVDFKRITSCSCAELDEQYDGKGVTLAGMITNVRAINTKKGDQMAFVQLEDLQGSCEVVFFPKAYAEYKEKLAVDAVVIVKGKAQTRENQTTLLADLVQTYVESYVEIGGGTPAPQEAWPPTSAEIRAVDTAVVRSPSDRATPDSFEEASNGWYDSEANPFLSEMPEWMQEAPPLVALPGTQPAAEPVASVAPARQEGAALPDTPVAPGLAHGAVPVERPISPAPSRGPFFTEPRRAARRLLITFRRTGNLERDKYRLKELYEVVREPKGRDAFAIRLLDTSRSVELTFPNDGCTINERLTLELQKHFRVDYEVEETR
jgi:DNA polymerase-3 subunit alpha